MRGSQRGIIIIINIMIIRVTLSTMLLAWQLAMTLTDIILQYSCHIYVSLSGPESRFARRKRGTHKMWQQYNLNR